ncbi:hypothetical protein NSK_007410 [Nannochloropsis salina CCMP1776]|uniref:WRKY19-like zinc finger domain-containing protein n=1 Tax=Nannochloropsis salina CCMP1776 TaxID=1027361 RepID=A0A4D9CY59_9STRA|nr:hypothetical protein NSK_007410 [Nannochloropsis salina CCMP1776]|eukprot:TFJ81449.1 hypothetical protein NSK_007410 [Nannochloropsis salina CCMP1776]
MHCDRVEMDVFPSSLGGRAPKPHALDDSTFFTPLHPPPDLTRSQHQHPHATEVNPSTSGLSDPLYDTEEPNLCPGVAMLAYPPESESRDESSNGYLPWRLGDGGGVLEGKGKPAENREGGATDRSREEEGPVEGNGGGGDAWGGTGSDDVGYAKQGASDGSQDPAPPSYMPTGGYLPAHGPSNPFPRVHAAQKGPGSGPPQGASPPRAPEPPSLPPSGPALPPARPVERENYTPSAPLASPSYPLPPSQPPRPPPPSSSPPPPPLAPLNHVFPAPPGPYDLSYLDSHPNSGLEVEEVEQEVLSSFDATAPGRTPVPAPTPGPGLSPSSSSSSLSSLSLAGTNISALPPPLALPPPQPPAAATAPEVAVRKRGRPRGSGLLRQNAEKWLKPDKGRGREDGAGTGKGGEGSEVLPAGGSSPSGLKIKPRRRVRNNRKKRLCQVVGCGKLDKGRGYCKGHGGGTRCQAGQCPKSARGSSGLCIEHGGGPRCAWGGGNVCLKSARTVGGFCKAHGGGVQCQRPGCGRLVRGAGVLCGQHGGKREGGREGLGGHAWEQGAGVGGGAREDLSLTSGYPVGDFWDTGPRLSVPGSDDKPPFLGPAHPRLLPDYPPRTQNASGHCVFPPPFPPFPPPCPPPPLLTGP